MFENIANSLDINKFLITVIDTIMLLFKLPLEMWNRIPFSIRLAFYGLVVLVSILIVILTWKYKEIWRYVN